LKSFTAVSLSSGDRALTGTIRRGAGITLISAPLISGKDLMKIPRQGISIQRKSLA
jgi:hypothetical protein